MLLYHIWYSEYHIWHAVVPFMVWYFNVMTSSSSKVDIYLDESFSIYIIFYIFRNGILCLPDYICSHCLLFFFISLRYVRHGYLNRLINIILSYDVPVKKINEHSLRSYVSVRCLSMHSKNFYCFNVEQIQLI